MVTIPTLPVDTHHSVKTAIKNLGDHANDLERQLAELRAHVLGLPKPMSLQEISRGLSSTGEAPLNINGLKGTLAP